MRTYITIYLTNGVYGFMSKHDVNPSIWIEEGKPGIMIRSSERLKCHQMLGEAWKFTIDPWRDTTEVYCGESEGTHPLRIIIEKVGEDKFIDTVFDFHLPREKYLSGQEILIREGEIPYEDLWRLKPTKIITRRTTNQA